MFINPYPAGERRVASASMVRIGGENVFDQGVNYLWSAIYGMLFLALQEKSEAARPRDTTSPSRPLRLAATAVASSRYGN